MITTGLKFVKAANMWCVFKSYNTPKQTNEIFWFSTQQQAQVKLDELKMLKEKV